MKRSQINQKIKLGIAFLKKMNYKVPPFVYWTPEEWQQKGCEYDELRICGLGWDITDFGLGDFDNTGLLVITVRNGIAGNQIYSKEYAEKCLILQEKQVTPMHFHHRKMEDIINRGGGDLFVELYNAASDDQLEDTDVEAQIDGRRFCVSAGTRIKLTPGESITIKPRQYHTFWAEGGYTLVGEVSKVNDDIIDNHFLTAPSRFPEIEEDETPKFLLFSEYPKVN